MDLKIDVPEEPTDAAQPADEESPPAVWRPRGWWDWFVLGLAALAGLATPAIWWGLAGDHPARGWLTGLLLGLAVGMPLAWVALKALGRWLSAKARQAAWAVSYIGDKIS